MEVRSRAGTGIAQVGDHIAAFYPIAYFNIQSGIVRKERFYTISVADFHHVAVTRTETGFDHNPVGRGWDRDQPPRRPWPPARAAGAAPFGRRIPRRDLNGRGERI